MAYVVLDRSINGCKDEEEEHAEEEEEEEEACQRHEVVALLLGRVYWAIRCFEEDLTL